MKHISFEMHYESIELIDYMIRVKHLELKKQKQNVVGVQNLFFFAKTSQKLVKLFKMTEKGLLLKKTQTIVLI